MQSAKIPILRFTLISLSLYKDVPKISAFCVNYFSLAGFSKLFAVDNNRMKKSGIVAASVAAATAARATTSSTVSFNTKSQYPPQQEDVSSKERDDSSPSSAARDKFAPRFDGLRFIETLITAHR